MAYVDHTALRAATQRLVDPANQVDAHWDGFEPRSDDQLDPLLAEAGQAEETWREAFRASILLRHIRWPGYSSGSKRRIRPLPDRHSAVFRVAFGSACRRGQR